MTMNSYTVKSFVGLIHTF